ncbi:hypothetical protein ACOMCU_02075 [Lysinibacillus sp. UGB7]|uniref:hypothetical protein n=1 Tax=Lysinibacillus sp. UGB7 TaxID=3411039 RepID=UPI003B819E49
MNRINKVGQEMIEYKNELAKNYPDLVKRSMISVLEQLVSVGTIDLDTLNYVKNESVSIIDFERFIKESPLFEKTKEEIIAELRILEDRLKEILDLKDIEDLKTSIIERDEMVLVNQVFVFDEAFVLRYFDISDESEVTTLMKRGGFVEKLAVLRLNAILKPFLREKKAELEKVEMDLSFVVYDNALQGYKIEIYFAISEDKFDDEEELLAYVDTIMEVAEDARTEFEQKTIA